MMLDEYKLHEDVTLKKLYEIRKEWVPAFLKGFLWSYGIYAA
jgi:hypothetical protein